VTRRANDFGVKGFLIPTGDIEEARKAVTLCNKMKNTYMTIGLHPCRAMEPYK
jgi:TatD DNase family protein